MSVQHLSVTIIIQFKKKIYIILEVMLLFREAYKVRHREKVLLKIMWLILKTKWEALVVVEILLDFSW